MYIVASIDSNPRGGGQLPDPNECNSTLTSATREETIISNSSECNSTLDGLVYVFNSPFINFSNENIDSNKVISVDL